MFLLVDGTPYSDDIGASYVINMKKPSIFPAEGRVESIESFKATFFDYEAVELTDIKPYLLTVDTDEKIDFSTIECNKNIVNMKLSAPVTQNSSYRLVFPVGSIKANDIVNEDAFEFNYIIRSSSVKVSVSPAPGTYASLPELTVTFDGAQSIRQGFSYSKAPTYEINGTKKMIMSFTVVDNKLTLRPNLTEEGVYTISIPADCIYVDNELHDKSYSWDYTIDSSSSAVSEIANDEMLWDIYRIDGVKVATAITEVQATDTLSKGIYILVKGSERRKMVIR